MHMSRSEGFNWSRNKKHLEEKRGKSSHIYMKTKPLSRVLIFDKKKLIFAKKLKNDMIFLFCYLYMLGVEFVKIFSSDYFVK